MPSLVWVSSKMESLPSLSMANNSEVLPTTLHTYEIGSLTKTFTATMIAKASRELRINLDETIDSYLDLPADNNYPNH